MQIRTKMKKLLLVFLLSGTVFQALAQVVSINNFLVKESLLKNSQLAVIAADSLNQPLSGITGLYTFSISGFSQSLDFKDGVAVIPLQIERSTFVYIKHINESGTHSKLVYVYKKDGTLTPYPISTWWMIAIPVIIVVLALAFRKFILIAIILLLIFGYFNYSNGLNLTTFFETIFDGLKRLF